MSDWNLVLAEEYMPTEGLMLPPKDQSGTQDDYIARHRKAINDRDSRHRERVTELAKAFDKVRADALEEAAELVNEMGTGHADITAGLIRHIRNLKKFPPQRMEG